MQLGRLLLSLPYAVLLIPMCYPCSSPLLQVPDTVDAALRDAHHEGKGGITFEEFEKMMLTAKDDDLDLYESRLRPDSR